MKKGSHKFLVTLRTNSVQWYSVLQYWEVIRQFLQSKGIPLHS